LSSQDDLRIRRALDKDDADIDWLLNDIMCSDIDTKAVMQLKGIDAEQFLTVTYSVCASASLFFISRYIKLFYRSSTRRQVAPKVLTNSPETGPIA
jgi:hypothetical protein